MYLYNNNNYYYSFWTWKPFRTIILFITAMWYFLSIYCWIQFVNILLKCSVGIFMRNIVCLIIVMIFWVLIAEQFWYISGYVYFFAVFLIVMFLGESVHIWCDFSSKKMVGKTCTGEFVTGSLVVIICLDVSRYKFSFCRLIDFAGYPWYNVFIICLFHVNNQVCWHELLKLIPHCLSKYSTIKNNALLSTLTLLILSSFLFSWTKTQASVL